MKGRQLQQAFDGLSYILGFAAQLHPVTAMAGFAFQELLSSIRQKRVDDAIEHLNNEITAHRAEVQENYINNTDFVDIFHITIRKVVDERSERKREWYSNILLHSILTPNIDYDETEQQLKILEQLLPAHVEFLKLFNDPVLFMDQGGKLNFETNILLTFLQDAFPQFDTQSITDYMEELSTYRLIRPINNNVYKLPSPVDFHSTAELLSERGRRFISFLIRD